MFKKIALIISLLLCTLIDISAQNDSIKPKQVITGFWVSPSRATKVNGIMFNLFPKFKGDFGPRIIIDPTINGVELDLNPLGPIATGFLIIPAVFGVFNINFSTPLVEDSSTRKLFKKVNGLELSFVVMEQTIISGLDVNIGGCFASKIHGVCISGIMNKNYLVNGVEFAVLRNITHKCSGIQIGLINSCDDLKGLQIGLYNINQKRSLPIINWSFK
ncbi:MAG: hypothetical protein V2A54_14475 [Bacteroidota bacterium]